MQRRNRLGTVSRKKEKKKKKKKKKKKTSLVIDRLVLIASSRNHTDIILTPLNLTLYTVKHFFLFLLKHISCGYSLEPPRCGSNDYNNLCFELKYEKYQNFYLKTFSFWW